MVLSGFSVTPAEVSKVVKPRFCPKIVILSLFVIFVTFGGGTEMCQFVQFVSFVYTRKNVVLEGVFLLTE